jgi:Lon protease-like protein
MLPEYLDIPIFPLPNVTFFPQTTLPLHVFEPRYLTMTANCLAGDRLLGLSLLKDGWQKDYFGRPPLCKTFTVGKIADARPRAKAGLDIVLEGLYRVRLVGEYPTGPYRTGRVRVLQERPIDGQRAQFGQGLREIRQLTDHIGRMLPQTRESIQSAWSVHPHPLVIINQLASALVIDAYERQSILEQDDPLRRLALITIQLRALAVQLGERVREGLLEDE